MSTFTGTARDDDFAAGSDDDKLIGGGGNDRLSGGAGNDVLEGDDLVEAAPIRIAAFGDSLIDPIDGAPEQNLPAQLDRVLTDDGIAADILDFGVGGEKSGQGLLRVGDVIAANPDIAIVEFGTNDSIHLIPPADVYVNLDAIISQLLAHGIRVVLLGTYATWPDHTGQTGYSDPQDIAAFEAIYPDLAAKYGIALVPNLLAGVRDDPALAFGDGIHPNAAGVAQIAANIAPSIETVVNQIDAPGNDTLIGGPGDDTLVGGAGVDVALYSGAFADYSITIGPTATIRDLRGNDGTDTLSGVERAQFTDRVVFLDGTDNAPIAHTDFATTNARTVVSGNVLANDRDIDNDPLHAAAQNLTSQHGASVTIAADGSFVYDPRASADLASLVSGGHLVDSFQYTADDGRGGSDVGTVQITVGGVSDHVVDTGHDSTGDHSGDLLVETDSGGLALWSMGGGGPTTQPLPTPDPSAWYLAGRADLDGDGLADLVWRSTGDGSLAFWDMKGTTITGAGQSGPVDQAWSLQGFGDFDGNRTEDVLWRHQDGAVALWSMDGAAVTGSAEFGAVTNAWALQGTGDVNGDGQSDVIWRHSNGDVALWIMNNGTISYGEQINTVTNAWTFLGACDFDGNGTADLLWRHTDGTVAAWHMANGAVDYGAAVATVAAGTQLAGIGDYNADGKADLAWRDANGQISVWFMDGLTVASTRIFGTLDAAAHIV